MCLWIFITSCFARQDSGQFQNNLNDTFIYAIEINEEFKILKNNDQQKIETRKQVEKYYEEKLSPIFKDYINYIKTNNDIELSVLFFKLVLSYKNSADEGLSYTCGDFFRKNSELVFDVIKMFAADDKKYIYSQIDYGLEQIRATEKLSGFELADMNFKLNELSLLVNAQ